MEELLALLNRSYYGNTLGSWLEAAVIFVGLLTVLPLLRLLLTRRLKSGKPPESPAVLELFLEILQGTTWLFLLMIALYCALKVLELPHKLDRAADVIIQLVLWFQVALWGAEAVGFGIDQKLHQVAGTRAPTLNILRFVGMLVVWAVAALMLLSNLGVNITTLVTGLGIGGVAVALAVQNVLGDLLASLSIALDKPFEVGDTLRIDDLVGKVENVGIKTTRIRSIDGDQLIIGNAQLLSAKLHNLGRMAEQRVLYVFGVAADTGLDKLRLIPSMIERLVKALPGTRLDHCFLRGFGNGALEFETVFYVLSSDRTAAFEAQQQFSLRLVERCGTEGITLNTGGATRAPPQKAVPAAPVGRSTA